MAEPHGADAGCVVHMPVWPAEGIVGLLPYFTGDHAAVPITRTLQRGQVEPGLGAAKRAGQCLPLISSFPSW